MSFFFWLDSSRTFPVTQYLLICMFLVFVIDKFTNDVFPVCTDRSVLVRPHTLVAASLLERSFIKFLLTLLFLVKFLIPVESLWSSRPVLEYILFVLFSSNLSELITAKVLNRPGPYFGCGPLLIAISVAHRHAFPLTPLAPSLTDLIPKRLFQSRHLPFILIVAEIIGRLTFPSAFTESHVSLFSLFFAWLHIRYFQYFPFAQVRGDHSEEFAFPTLFPRFTRKAMASLCDVVYTIVSAKSPFFRLRTHEKISAVEVAAVSTGVYARAETEEAENVGKSLEDKAAWESRRQRALRFLDSKSKAVETTFSNPLV